MTKCTRCYDLCPKEQGMCEICQIAVTKNPFPYNGVYDSDKDEYIPECKDCYGEGWRGFRNPINADYIILPCSCNPEKLSPKPCK